MTIYRPTWERSIGIKTWGKSIAMGMILIVSPPKRDRHFSKETKIYGAGSRDRKNS